MDGISTMSFEHMDSMTPLFGGSGGGGGSSLFGGSQNALGGGGGDRLTYNPNVDIGSSQQAPPGGPPPPMSPFTPVTVPSAGRGQENIPQGTQMDSTPIADLMGPPGAVGAGMMMGDAGLMQAGGGYPPLAPQQQQALVSSSGSGKRLNKEQMEALLAGVIAVLVFSKPVQKRLTGFVPQMLDGSNLSNIGYIIIVLVVAIAFYFGKRFVK